LANVSFTQPNHAGKVLIHLQSGIFVKNCTNTDIRAQKNIALTYGRRNMTAGT